MNEAQEGQRLAAIERLKQEQMRASWSRLKHGRDFGSPARAEELDRWLQFSRELRETQAMMTAVAIHRATASLRECASTLLQGPGLRAPADAARMLPRPGESAPRQPMAPTPPAAAAIGLRFTGRGNVSWTVVSMVWDAIEPGYYLAQLEREPGDGHTVDVYSEDWPVFCVVEGLRLVESPMHAATPMAGTTL